MFSLVMLLIILCVGCTKNQPVKYFKTVDEAIAFSLEKENGEFLDKEEISEETLVFFKVENKLGVFSVSSSNKGYYSTRNQALYQISSFTSNAILNVTTGNDKSYKFIVGSVEDPKITTVNLVVRESPLQTKAVTPKKPFYYFLLNDPQVKEREIRIELK